MTARDEILLKVKRALGGHQPPALPDHAPLSPQPVGLATGPQRDALVRQFASALVRVGGHFSVAANAKAVCDEVAKIASGVNAKKAVGWHSPELLQLGLAGRLAELGVEFVTDRERADKAAFLDEAAEAGLGITPVDYALADSGTLCLLAKKNQPRTASLLPPIHVAVLRPAQIIGGLDDLFALLPAGGDLSSAVTLITGPSRTADIELTLVVGVHGPQRLHVILADWS